MQAVPFRRGLLCAASLCLIVSTGCASGNKIKFPWQKSAQAPASAASAQVAQSRASDATMLPPYSQARTTPPTTQGPMIGQHVKSNTAQHPDAGKPLVDNPNVEIPKLPILQRVQFGPLQ